MKYMNVAKRFGAKVAAGGSMLAAGTAAAMADLPPDVATALDSAKTDSSSAAYLVIGVIAVIFGIMLIKRVIK